MSAKPKTWKRWAITNQAGRPDFFFKLRATKKDALLVVAEWQKTGGYKGYGVVRVEVREVKR